MKANRFLALSIATLLVGGAARAEPGVGDKEIRIGVCSVYSGPIKDVGGDELAGAKAYIEHVNREQGGVHGRKIVLISHDDEYDPNKAVACFNGLLEDDIFVGAFFAGSKTAAKYVEMAQARKFPIVGIVAGNSFLYEPFKHYVFSVRATARDELGAEIGHLWDDLGYRKYAVIFQNDALGSSGLRGVEQALRKKGAKPLALSSFPTNSKEVDDAIRIARASNPDVVVLVGGYFSVAEVLKRSHDAGWKPVFVVSPGRDELIKLAGPAAAEGALWALVVPPPDETRLAGVALFHRLMKEYSPNVAANNKAEEGFIHAMVLVEGLKKAGPDLGREKFIDTMETLHGVDLGFGPGYEVNFSPDNHQGFNKVIFGIVEKGRLKVFTDWKKTVGR